MPDEIIEKLVNTITQHYATTGTPLLLSRLGQLHPGLLKEIKQAFPSLAAAVQAAGPERLVIVRPAGGGGGQETVAPTDLGATVEKTLNENSATLKSHGAAFDSLPFPIRLAFCLRNEAGEHIAVRLVPPFRYDRITSLDLLRPSYVVVADEFRRPGLILTTANAQEKEGLWRSFLAWTESVGVDPGSFTRGDRPTALQRLLAAQDPAILARLNIPADIAALLLKRD
jgi:hypothetical protein